MPADFQDVELDMTTFTPEVRLQLAKVIESRFDANYSGVLVTKFRRPLPVDETEEGYEGGDFDEEGEMMEVGESEEQEAEVVQISMEDLHRRGQNYSEYRFVPNIMALALAL